ncbi:MAG: DUF429 domain-containing protein [Planctomycetota bacterium]|nr:DUF429 domain-containing protein [Planctomycetota bacterium]
MSSIYLGYDPGGGGAHGVAAINGNNVVSDTLLTAQHAIDWFREICRDREIIVLGVDTLTLWSTGPSGWRPADRALRATYPAVANSVTSSNSLYGAMPINGAVVMRMLAERVESLPITETHPKVLYFALTGNVYDYAEQSGTMIQSLTDWIGEEEININSEHAWDALISAYAARQWHTKAWTDDLHQLPQSDNEQLTPVFGDRACFAWPKKVRCEETAQRDVAAAPVQQPGGGARGRDLWRVAVERLQRAGHDDVAQQIEEYRNTLNERSGWDAWLKSNFPALWELYEAGE